MFVSLISGAWLIRKSRKLSTRAHCAMWTLTLENKYRLGFLLLRCLLDGSFTWYHEISIEYLTGSIKSFTIKRYRLMYQNLSLLFYPKLSVGLLNLGKGYLVSM